MLVFAFGSALVARFPFLGSFSWWFGRDPQAAYHVAIAVVGLGVLGAVNFIDTQRRRARFREREQNAGPGEIVLPDWCHDYTSCGDGGDGGSGGGGDGGGGD